MEEFLRKGLDFPKIFLINLAERKDRRDFMVCQLLSLGVEFELVEAVSGKDMSDEDLERSYDKRRAVAEGKRELTLGEIGCALSHLKVCKKIVDEGLDCAIIMEDDQLIGREFMKATKGAVEQVDKGSSCVVLLHYASRHYIFGRKISDIHSIHRMASAAYTSSYIITKSAAQSMLRHLYPVWCVSDSWKSFVRMQVIEAYVVRPYTVGHASIANNSDLQGDRLKFQGAAKNSIDCSTRSRFARRGWKRALKEIGYFLRGMKRNIQSW